MLTFGHFLQYPDPWKAIGDLLGLETPPTSSDVDFSCSVTGSFDESKALSVHNTGSYGLTTPLQENQAADEHLFCAVFSQTDDDDMMDGLSPSDASMARIVHSSLHSYATQPQTSTNFSNDTACGTTRFNDYGRSELPATPRSATDDEDDEAQSVLDTTLRYDETDLETTLVNRTVVPFDPPSAWLDRTEMVECAGAARTMIASDRLTFGHEDAIEQQVRTPTRDSSDLVRCNNSVTVEPAPASTFDFLCAQSILQGPSLFSDDSEEE